MSAHFAGFILGAFLCVRVVAEVGPIRAHDVLRPDQALEATRGLMLVFGIGAALGPFRAGLVMAALGAAAPVADDE